MTISHDPSAPLVVVTGATGQQGGSVIRALTESDRPYHLRGLTRDPAKPVACALASQGIQIFGVSLTVDNKEKVYEAFEGGDIVFGVTNFWEHVNKQREIDEGKLLIDAAKAAGVTLFVWSGLEPVAKLSKGKFLHVDHFDGKAEVTEYGRQSGVPFTDVQAGFYSSNFGNIGGMKLRAEADGSYNFVSPIPPDTLIPLIDTPNDYGLFVREAIESPEFGAGSEIFAWGELISLADMIAQFSEITGKKVTYVRNTPENFKASTGAPERIAQEILESFLAIHEIGYFGVKNIHSSQQHLARRPRTWADYVKSTDWSSVLSS